jgi:membrane protein implicated in regulation of membrane protease activity
MGFWKWILIALVIIVGKLVGLALVLCYFGMKKICLSLNDKGHITFDHGYD